MRLWEVELISQALSVAVGALVVAVREGHIRPRAEEKDEGNPSEPVNQCLWCRVEEKDLAGYAWKDKIG
jgi:hypothetical protein